VWWWFFLVLQATINAAVTDLTLEAICSKEKSKAQGQAVQVTISLGQCIIIDSASAVLNNA
jgi:hypothetical protein